MCRHAAAALAQASTAGIDRGPWAPSTAGKRDGADHEEGLGPDVKRKRPCTETHPVPFTAMEPLVHEFSGPEAIAALSNIPFGNLDHEFECLIPVALQLAAAGCCFESHNNTRPRPNTARWAAPPHTTRMPAGADLPLGNTAANIAADATTAAALPRAESLRRSSRPNAGCGGRQQRSDGRPRGAEPAHRRRTRMPEPAPPAPPHTIRVPHAATGDEPPLQPPPHVLPLGRDRPRLPAEVLAMKTIEWNQWRRRPANVAVYGDDAVSLRAERRRSRNAGYSRDTRRNKKAERERRECPAKGKHVNSRPGAAAAPKKGESKNSRRP